MKKGALILAIILLHAIALIAQECDSALYIFFGDFSSLHICTKSLRKLPVKNSGTAYELGDFSIRNKKNNVLFDFPSPGGDAYKVSCFNDSIIIYERFYLPFICEYEPCIGMPGIGPRDIYKYRLTKSSTSYKVNKQDVYIDYAITSDSLKSVKEELEKKIDRLNLIHENIEAYVQKYGEPDSLLVDLSSGNFYWLIFLGYYNDDKECESYLKDWDKYIPIKTSDPNKHATIIKNILWYKTLKKPD